MYIKYPVFSKDLIDCSYVSWYSITATSSQCVKSAGRSFAGKGNSFR